MTSGSSTRPLDALDIARENPDKQVVFFGIGFETTAPPNAMTVYEARRLGIENFSLLVSHVRVPPAIEAIMTVAGVPGAGLPSGRSRLHGDGHRGVPGARRAVPGPDRGHRLRAAGHPRGHPARRAPARGRRHEVENAYARVVTDEGNPAAQPMLDDVFEVTDRSLARHRDDPAERLAAVREVPGVRRRAPVRGRRHRHPGVDGLPQRRGAPGADQAARVRGVRHARARRATRSARRWSPARAPARRTTSTAGWRREPSSPTRARR